MNAPVTLKALPQTKLFAAQVARVRSVRASFDLGPGDRCFCFVLLPFSICSQARPRRVRSDRCSALLVDDAPTRNFRCNRTADEFFIATGASNDAAILSSLLIERHGCNLRSIFFPRFADLGLDDSTACDNFRLAFLSPIVTRATEKANVGFLKVRETGASRVAILDA